MNIVCRQRQALVATFVFYLGIACFLVMHAGNVYADIGSAAEAFTPNMVKIDTSHLSGEEDRGFGLIMFEKDGYLYIATPKHIIEDKYARGRPNAIMISVTLRYADNAIPAEFIRKHPNHDIALVRAKKPAGFNWNYAKLSGEIEKGMRVWILGYNWRWDLQPQATVSRIVYVSRADITASTTVKVGTSGGLLITEDKVVGMITASNEQENTLYAYRLDFLASVIHNQWLENEIAALAPPDPFPYMSLGAYGNVSLFMTSVEEEKAPLTYGAGFNIDYIWSSRYGIRYSHYNGNISAEVESLLSTESIRFRNDFTLDMVYFMYGGKLAQTPYTLATQGVSFAYIGFGVGEHNPELNINDQGWRRLDSYNEFSHEYSDTFHALILGLSAERSFAKNFSGGFEMGFTFTDEKYIAIDVVRPFNENSVNDFYLYFNLYLSYSFGKPPAPQVKLLY